MQSARLIIIKTHVTYTKFHTVRTFTSVIEK